MISFHFDSKYLANVALFFQKWRFIDKFAGNCEGYELV